MIVIHINKHNEPLSSAAPLRVTHPPGQLSVTGVCLGLLGRPDGPSLPPGLFALPVNPETLKPE